MATQNLEARLAELERVSKDARVPVDAVRNAQDTARKASMRASEVADRAASAQALASVESRVRSLEDSAGALVSRSLTARLARVEKEVRDKASTTAVQRLRNMVQELDEELHGAARWDSKEDQRQDEEIQALRDQISDLKSKTSATEKSQSQSQSQGTHADARQDAAMKHMQSVLTQMQSQGTDADARQDAAVASLTNAFAQMQSQLAQVNAGTEADARQDAAVARMQAAIQSLQASAGAPTDTDARQDAAMKEIQSTLQKMKSQSTDADARQDAAMRTLEATQAEQIARLEQRLRAKQEEAIKAASKRTQAGSRWQAAASKQLTNQKFSSLEWRKTIIDARLQKRLEEQDVRGMLPELRAAIADLQERAGAVDALKKAIERLPQVEERLAELEARHGMLAMQIQNISQSAASATALGTVDARVSILEQEVSARASERAATSRVQGLELRLTALEAQKVLSPQLEARMAEISAFDERIAECEALKDRLAQCELRAASATKVEELAIRVETIAATKVHGATNFDLQTRLATVEELAVHSQELGQQVRLELTAQSGAVDQRISSALGDLEVVKTVLFGPNAREAIQQWSPGARQLPFVQMQGPLAGLLAASQAASAGGLGAEPSFSGDPVRGTVLPRVAPSMAAVGTPGSAGTTPGKGSRSVIKDVDDLAVQVGELQVLLAESGTDLAAMQASVDSTSGDVRHLMSDTYRRVEAHAAAIGTLGKSITKGMETRPTLEKVNGIVDAKLDERMTRVQRRIEMLESEYDDVRGRILRIGRAFETATTEIEQRLLVITARQSGARSSASSAATSPAAFGRVIQGALNESRLARGEPSATRSPRTAEKPPKQLSFSGESSEEIEKLKSAVKQDTSQILQSERSIDETMRSIDEEM